MLKRIIFLLVITHAQPTTFLHLALIVVPFELEISSNDEENSIENDGLTVSFRFTNIEHLLTGLTKT